MNLTGRSWTGMFASRSALALALALGMTAGAATVSSPAAAAKKPQAPKISPSKGFVAVAAPAQEAINQLDGNDSAAVAQARAQLDQVFAAVENEDDRYMAGSLALNLGGKASDPALQRKGVEAMIASGKADAETMLRLQTAAGQLALQAKDYAAAQRYLKMAIDGGAPDAELKAYLAESYIATNQVDQGLDIFRNAISQSAAAGDRAPDSWYRRALISAYNAKKINEAAEFGALLIRDYPDPMNVGLATTILRDLGGFASQETLDLMRLMGRTDSYAEERDYVEYIQAADPRRLPGEVLKVIEAGTASGKLNASDTFVSDARSQAKERAASDRASLTSYANDARKPNAPLATITGAADALLSYGEAAQAEELYKLALTRGAPDEAMVLTRLGIAQFDQGKYAEAQATFAKVSGKRGPIARLWSAYAAQRAGGAAAAPETAAAQ